MRFDLPFCCCVDCRIEGSELPTKRRSRLVDPVAFLFYFFPEASRAKFEGEQCVAIGFRDWYERLKSSEMVWGGIPYRERGEIWSRKT